MKTSLLFAATVSLVALTSNAQAGEGGSCHFHGSKPATDAVVSDCAGKRRDALVKAGKLDSSWAGVALATVELIDGKKGKEWKVSFANPGASDPAKQTLYVFFSHPGNFIAANFTGQ